jgi:hypothetical protein
LSPRLKARLPLVAAFAVAAVAGRACAPAPPARTIEGVALMLGASVHGSVRPGDFVWERPEGVLWEGVFGRNVLFLASETPGGPRDVYRARVRVSLEGHPIDVRAVHNLTATPLGDDLALTADGPYAAHHAAFASTAYGRIAGVTLLDLDGGGEIVGAKGFFDRFLGGITNSLEVGTYRGIGRIAFTIDPPATAVKLGFEKDGFVVSAEGAPPASFDFAKASLRAAPDDARITAEVVPHLRKAPILWAVDTVRGVVGPGPIAFLEDTFFGARDSMRRAQYGLVGKAATTRADMKEDSAPPPPPLDASAAGEEGGYWPPPKLSSIWQEPEEGEGVWKPITHSFLKKLPGATSAPPAYFQETWVKPDSKRPYAKVLVVAMDMRQLEVGMEGGVEDPKPLTGTKSFGRIPRDPEILNRVVGAFNGAFKTTHGAYGMMVDKRVLLPPKTGAATVVITEDHRVGMGTWGASETIPDDLASYRQNLDALVEDGKLNPTGRTQWGFQLAGTSVLTERSGICVTKPGHFFYFWGDDVTALTLGKAMVQAGCSYGMHLDMNPKHTGFVFASIRDVKHKDYDAKLLTPQMEIQPDRYIEWSPKDFFYVMLRPTDALPGDGLKWSVDKGAQPAPAWLPAIRESRTTISNVDVDLTAIDAGRALFRVRVGQGEAAADDASPRDLPPDEQKRVLAALGLGNGRKPSPMGLALEGKQLSSSRGKNGWVVIDASGEMRVVATDPPAAASTLALVELPLVVSNGNTTLFAEGQGTTRARAALCTLPGGRTIIARSTASSDVHGALALAKLGCKTAVALDRGGHEPSFYERAGTGAAAKTGRGEQTTLFAVATPMRPRAFPWKP